MVSIVNVSNGASKTVMASGVGGSNLQDLYKIPKTIGRIKTVT